MHKLLSLFVLFLVSFKNMEHTTKPSGQNVLVDPGKEIEGYFSFAKVYGYIKYFYPGDEAAAIDWDKFAYYGARYVGDASDGNIQKYLDALFLPIAPEISMHSTEEDFWNVKRLNATRPDEKPVYWQHLGDGKGCIGYPYKSMRVNRPARVLLESSNDFANMRLDLPVGQFSGKEIRLSGKLIADPLFTGRPSFIILVKEKGKDIQRYSTEGQAVSDIKWSTHSIVARIPEDAERVTVVIQSITLSGAVKFDDLLLEVNEKNEWQVEELFSFNEMNMEQLTGSWKMFSPNQDIELTGGKGEQVVLFSRTKGMMKEIDPLFSKAPAENEWITKTIGSGLSISFPIVLYTGDLGIKSNGDKEKYHELTKAIESIPVNSYKAENVYTRIANVIILWNKIQHFHPDNHLTTAQWELELRKALQQSLHDKTIEDHRKTLTQMIAPVNDSHMTLYYNSIVTEEFYLPLRWEKIENKIVITDVLDSTLGITKGDIVTDINGVSAEEYWNQINKSVTGATASRRQFKMVDESLKGREGTVVKIKTLIHPEKITMQRKLTEFEFNKLIKKAKKPDQYQQVKDGIYYINLTEISWNDLQTHLAELAAAKGIVFDLRGYPKWQTHNIVSHFIKKPVYQMVYGIPEIIYPDRDKIEFIYNMPDTLEPKLPYISASKLFLTDGSAISYAEDFLNLVSFYQLAKIVGEPTAGTTGNVNMCFLFGGLSTPWTGMRVIKRDNTLFNGKGVLPDHYVNKTIAGIKAGTDEYLQYVLKNLFN